MSYISVRDSVHELTSLLLTVCQADAAVAGHAITLQHSGPFTFLIDSSAGQSHQEQEHQTPHDGLSARANVSTAAAKCPFIEKFS